MATSTTRQSLMRTIDAHFGQNTTAAQTAKQTLAGVLGNEKAPQTSQIEAWLQAQWPQGQSGQADPFKARASLDQFLGNGKPAGSFGQLGAMQLGHGGMTRFTLEKVESFKPLKLDVDRSSVGAKVEAFTDDLNFLLQLDPQAEDTSDRFAAWANINGENKLDNATIAHWARSRLSERHGALSIEGGERLQKYLSSSYTSVDPNQLFGDLKKEAQDLVGKQLGLQTFVENIPQVKAQLDANRLTSFEARCMLEDMTGAPRGSVSERDLENLMSSFFGATASRDRWSTLEVKIDPKKVEDFLSGNPTLLAFRRDLILAPPESTGPSLISPPNYQPGLEPQPGTAGMVRDRALGAAEKGGAQSAIRSLEGSMKDARSPLDALIVASGLQRLGEKPNPNAMGDRPLRMAWEVLQNPDLRAKFLDAAEGSVPEGKDAIWQSKHRTLVDELLYQNKDALKLSSTKGAQALLQAELPDSVSKGVSEQVLGFMVEGLYSGTTNSSILKKAGDAADRLQMGLPKMAGMERQVQNADLRTHEAFAPILSTLDQAMSRLGITRRNVPPGSRMAYQQVGRFDYDGSAHGVSAEELAHKRFGAELMRRPEIREAFQKDAWQFENAKPAEAIVAWFNGKSGKDGVYTGGSKNEWTNTEARVSLLNEIATKGLSDTPHGKVRDALTSLMAATWGRASTLGEGLERFGELAAELYESGGDHQDAVAHILGEMGLSLQPKLDGQGWEVDVRDTSTFARRVRESFEGEAPAPGKTTADATVDWFKKQPFTPHRMLGLMPE